MVCVRPGVLEKNASRRRLVSALMALDLPTFERPANASSGASCGGRPPVIPAETRNSTRENALLDAGMDEILIK
jgi:hypothetical protein